MSELLRARMILAGCVTALALAGCGGGGDSGTVQPPPAGNTPPAAPSNPDPLTPAPPVTPTPVAPGAPILTGNIALDGREWINFRRTQVGMSTLTRNTLIDKAAQGHSDYQRNNNIITHVQTPTSPPSTDFTGATVGDRLATAGYVFNTNNSRAFGEVISATSNGSGQYMAEELITAIYHRFVIFEPVFKEIGTGAATTSTGYNYFTVNFTANNGYGPGLASGQIAIWPFNGQTAVPPNFFSNTESPDPVREIKQGEVIVRPDLNEVGYPISVHANINMEIKVTSFTVRPRGGAPMAVQQLNKADDPEYTGQSSAAIVPLTPLNANTTYDVSFTGTVGGTPVSRTWSFTTQ